MGLDGLVNRAGIGDHTIDTVGPRQQRGQLGAAGQDDPRSGFLQHGREPHEQKLVAIGRLGDEQQGLARDESALPAWTHGRKPGLESLQLEPGVKIGPGVELPEGEPDLARASRVGSSSG